MKARLQVRALGSRKEDLTARDDIYRYIAYIRAQNQEIAKIACAAFKKILYLVEIDTLSRAAFPTVLGNRKRLVQFIDTCSHWNDKDRVSAVQLKLALEENGIQSGQLYDSINRLIDSWGYGHIIRPNDDLTFGKAQCLATPSECEYARNARYVELLYTYQNHLLHEFREPGHGMEVSDDHTTPYYLGMDHLDTGQSSWELVFPVQFLQSLCSDCISGLEMYLVANNLNPYNAYEFGTLWRRSR
jgi:hypothetical protein